MGSNGVTTMSPHEAKPDINPVLRLCPLMRRGTGFCTLSPRRGGGQGRRALRSHRKDHMAESQGSPPPSGGAHGSCWSSRFSLWPSLQPDHSSGLGITEPGGSGSPLCSHCPPPGCAQTLWPKTCCREACGHLASPAADRRRGPRFCTSCWAGVPCLCYWKDKKVLRFLPKAATGSLTSPRLSPMDLVLTFTPARPQPSALWFLHLAPPMICRWGWSQCPVDDGVPPPTPNNLTHSVMGFLNTTVHLHGLWKHWTIAPGRNKG